MFKSIKLDFRHFIKQGQHVFHNSKFEAAAKKAQKFHKILLEGKDPIIKDKDVSMTGWKTESPYVSDKELEKIQASANDFRSKIDDFVSIGIGGSYLGIQSTIEAIKGNIGILNILSREKRGGIPRIFFLGNHLDSDYTEKILEILAESNFGVNVISKSGGTVEPAAAFALVEKLAWDKFGNGAKDRIVATTDKEKGALKKLSEEKGYKTFVVPDNVGGRYSVTSAAGLFGLAVMGVNIKEFIAGARFAEEETRSRDFDKNIAMVRALCRYIAYDEWKKKIEVVSTADYNLRMAAAWMQQLGPETEGKDGKGLWISPEFYTQDVHANGQMIQEGERNIIETFLIVENEFKGITIPGKGTPIEYLDQKPLSFVNRSFLKGLREAHYEGGVPSMSYLFPDLDAYPIGQFYQYEMNAIALSGLLLGINPFIQPGVQMYKDIANAESGKPGYEELHAKMKAMNSNLDNQFVV